MGIGEVIKARRERIGMDPSTLARKAGLSHSTISRIESGHRPKPGGETLEKIGKVLGTTGSELLKEAQGAPVLNPVGTMVLPSRDLGLNVYPAHAGRVDVGAQGPIDSFHVRKGQQYLVKVIGECLLDMDIEPGDLLLVDLSVLPQSGKVVVARVGDELYLARWNTLNGKVRLSLSTGEVRDVWPDELELQGTVVWKFEPM